jgi:hypothetical protein
MIADILIIKRTELANVVIVTGKKTNPNLIRYFDDFQRVTKQPLRLAPRRFRHRSRGAAPARTAPKNIQSPGHAVSDVQRIALFVVGMSTAAPEVHQNAAEHVKPC